MLKAFQKIVSFYQFRTMTKVVEYEKKYEKNLTRTQASGVAWRTVEVRTCKMARPHSVSGTTVSLSLERQRDSPTACLQIYAQE